MNEGHFIDRYQDAQPRGKVIGSRNSTGILRRGVDQENVIGIDNGALRMEPLKENGWARCGIAYGPYKRENGLVMAVSLMNGHNTSQADSLNQPFKRRILDWILGNRTTPPHKRIMKWFRYGRKKRTFRMWRRWWTIQSQIRNGRYDTCDENLALGWFSQVVPDDPLHEGNAFIVHATGPENGELWANIEDALPPLIRGLQNIPLIILLS